MSRCSAAPGCPAHPRSRGENWRARPLARCQTGSSPLTRGKQTTHALKPSERGLIPAHAGKTKGIRVSPGACRAHPRSRGENATAPGTGSVRAGSSPLTRGKPGHRRARPHANGLIPAHAGKTLTAMAQYLPCGAHPRSRGENGSALFSNVPEPGSSPLTRGKRWWPGRFGVLVGLIPAHAGKTRGEERTHTVGWAHPRSRGENDAGVRAAFGL